jgi:hypothetical protein
MSIEQRVASIKQALEALFGEGSLSDKTRLALSLSETAGLHIFFTKVPWLIGLPKGKFISGLSENMRFAAKDIHAHLIHLERAFPPEAVVTIAIDETRLPTLQQTVPPSGVTDG